MAKLNLGFLASHGGSNMQAIIDACKSGYVDAVPACIISNNSKSGALERAEKEQIPHYHISSLQYPTQEELDSAISEKFLLHSVDIVILAGYMKKIGNVLLDKFPGKILNIHPALLPKYGGKGMYGKFVHEAVLEAGETKSGPTVHVIDSQYDKGKILGQTEVPVLADDTVETLAARVLEQEHVLYPETIKKIASGELKL